jgi:hypothetical protein
VGEGGWSQIRRQQQSGGLLQHVPFMNYLAQKWHKAAFLLAVYSFLVSLAVEEEEKTPQGEFLIGRLHEVIAMTTFKIIFYVKGDF